MTPIPVQVASQQGGPKVRKSIPRLAHDWRKWGVRWSRVPLTENDLRIGRAVIFSTGARLAHPAGTCALDTPPCRHNPSCNLKVKRR
jgi:hypothetical protein